ncbi:MAG: triple tyrosine motif-containing protein [Imperialibacter sp.]
MPAKRLIVVMTLWLQLSAFSQQNGVRQGIPFITNYSVEQYKAGSNNWSILQDANGKMYFGNHFGVLTFDGSRWLLAAQPKNKTIIRALAIDTHGTIYVGCQNELGYLTHDQNGQTNYVSLLEKLPPDERNFNDVWNIVVGSDAVYYHSTNAIFAFHGGEITITKHAVPFQFVTAISNKIFVKLEDGGLFYLRDGKLELAATDPLFTHIQVSFMVPIGRQYLVGTINHGLFLWDDSGLKEWRNPLASWLRQNKVKTGQLLQDGSIAIGTIYDGLLVLDSSLQFKLHINQASGLQDNLINFISEDSWGNLWLATENGIDVVEYHSPFTYWGARSGLSGSVYTLTVFNGTLYAGTAKGLFYLATDTGADYAMSHQLFQPVEGISQPTWNLFVHAGQLLAANHRGIYGIDGSRGRLLAPFPGTWSFQPLAADAELLLSGSYQGLALVDIRQNGARVDKLEGFHESSRVIVQESNGDIWVAHGYKGVYRLRIDHEKKSIQTLDFYDDEDGFPSKLFISVFQIRGEIVFGTEKGVYQFNPVTNKMEPHKFFQQALGGNQHVRLLQEDPNGNVWFVIGDEKDDRTGFLTIRHDGSYKMELTPFQRMKGKHVPGFENISFEGGAVFFGTKNGILRYDQADAQTWQESFVTLMSNVRLSANDSVISGNDSRRPEVLAADSMQATTIPHHLNSIDFSFAAPYFIGPDKMMYSLYLEGLDTDYSSWSHSNTKEYTNLKEGSYTFRVKARNIYGTESRPANFSFTVLPPWYRSSWAYVGYGAMVILVLFGLNQWKNQLFQSEKKRIKLDQVRELRLQHAERMKEKFEAENRIIHINKNRLEKELTANAMHLTQLNEKLIDIRSELDSLMAVAPADLKKQLSKTVNKINQDLESEDSWINFLTYFNQSHEDFLTRLQAEFPELNSMDLKLCAFLRMNLSSKQIAALLNITLRGVEASRLRVRKKLHLETTTNLTDFIIKF